MFPSRLPNSVESLEPFFCTDKKYSESITHIYVNSITTQLLHNGYRNIEKRNQLLTVDATSMCELYELSTHWKISN